MLLISAQHESVLLISAHLESVLLISAHSYSQDFCFAVESAADLYQADTDSGILTLRTRLCKKTPANESLLLAKRNMHWHKYKIMNVLTHLGLLY